MQLAAATSARVWANARLEVYPRDLDPIRALRLSQAGAGVPEDGLSPATLAARVAARFPGLDPLPDGLELSRLLRDAGVDLRWNGELVRWCRVGVSGRVPRRCRRSWMLSAPD